MDICLQISYELMLNNPADKPRWIPALIHLSCQRNHHISDHAQVTWVSVDLLPIDLYRDAAPIDLCAGMQPPLTCAGMQCPLTCAGMQHPLTCTGMQHPLTCRCRDAAHDAPGVHTPDTCSSPSCPPLPSPPLTAHLFSPDIWPLAPLAPLAGGKTGRSEQLSQGGVHTVGSVHTEGVRAMFTLWASGRRSHCGRQGGVHTAGVVALASVLDVRLGHG